MVRQAHLYHLMKSDSYSRYLRSEMYKEFMTGTKKKVSSCVFQHNALKLKMKLAKR